MSFWNAWNFFKSTVHEVVNWQSRHRLESFLVVLVSIGAGMAGGAVLGVPILVGGAYLGVNKNITEKREQETNKTNAELRKTVIAQQEVNIINTQLREGVLKNLETINNQKAEINHLKAQIIQEKIVSPGSQAKNDVPVKGSGKGLFSRTEVTKRSVTQCESTMSTNFEIKL
ncbi:MAG: hypothetical protein H0U57_07790 [Tatlockia sp.]|nr:hypothetical protein [Tatlockia sp.]